ncbi:hypothetical protein [Dactylosporangium sp. NPDC050588]|uniref:hypothetical protein n=1 Tax=Dactylosporangium sp. NPDC050588 TaxID=3157211 RepID=UPI0033D02853
MTVRWSGATVGEVAAAVEQFARRIAVFDAPPGGGDGGHGEGYGNGAGGGDVSGRGASGVEVKVGDAVVRLSPGVARAFVEALVSYQDPRDRGSCDHCGGARLDDNFVCADCGQPSGLFGQLLRERAARFEGPAGELGLVGE